MQTLADRISFPFSPPKGLLNFISLSSSNSITLETMEKSKRLLLRTSEYDDEELWSKIPPTTMCQIYMEIKALTSWGRCCGIVAYVSTCQAHIAEQSVGFTLTCSTSYSKFLLMHLGKQWVMFLVLESMLLMLETQMEFLVSDSSPDWTWMLQPYVESITR